MPTERTFTRPLPRFPRRRAVLGTLAVGVLVTSALIAGCGNDEASPPPPGGGPAPDAVFTILPNSFQAGNMAFSPPRDTVSVNAVVRMTNGDGIFHNIITQTSGGPDWGGVSAGGSRDVTVTQPGTFTFQCVVGGHVMSGTLVVEP